MSRYQDGKLAAYASRSRKVFDFDDKLEQVVAVITRSNDHPPLLVVSPGPGCTG